MDLLRKHGFSVDANYSKNGASQLFITAAIGDDRLQAAELLLQIGADVNYKSPAGLSVLSLATRNDGGAAGRVAVEGWRKHHGSK